VKVIFGIKRVSPPSEEIKFEPRQEIEESDEDIDDEAYIKRHDLMEQEEIKRYNVGLKVKTTSNSHKKKH
jgi:hypothetical protein